MEAPPLVAYGTMTATAASTSNALASGVRHLDCAELYADTLHHVGRAIAESGLERHALWITSKLNGMPCSPYEDVKARMEKQCQALGVTHVDLLLVHWPGEPDVDFGASPDAAASKCATAWFLAHIADAWSNMLRLRQDGLTRRIGVSNFYSGHLRALEEVAPAEPPFANQVFVDVTHQEPSLLDDMRERDIIPMAYRPLAFLPVVKMAGEMGDGTHAALEAQTAECGAENVQQLVLAWLARKGIVAVCSSGSPAHVEANLRAVALASRAPEVIGGDGADGNETVAMCGGLDEYAACFRHAAPTS